MMTNDVGDHNGAASSETFQVSCGEHQWLAMSSSQLLRTVMWNTVIGAKLVAKNKSPGLSIVICRLSPFSILITICLSISHQEHEAAPQFLVISK